MSLLWYSDLSSSLLIMSRLSIIKKSLLSEEVNRMILSKPLQYIFSTVIVGLLMMFLTLIVGLSSHLTDVSSGLTDKLGMYFYLSSDISTDTMNTKVVGLLKELEDANIKAQYLSQEDAVGTLEKKLPDIVKRFRDYNIDADLPSTLYVTIPNEQAHTTLINILPRYADIIENVEDINSASSVKTQEQRVLKALDFAYFLKGASIVLIIIFSMVMIGVVLLVLFFKLKQFEDIIALKKMLWATPSQMRNPFIVFIGLVIGGWFVTSLILTLLVGIGSIWRDQSLVYFSQLLGVEGMNTGIRGLLLWGYLSVLALVFIIAAIIWFIASVMIEHKIRQAH